MIEFPMSTVDQRHAQNCGFQECILGQHRNDKNSLLKTLNPETTLFLNIDAEEIPAEDWEGDSFEPRTWDQCRDFAVFLGGPNPAFDNDELYSQAHFDAVCNEKYGDPSHLRKFETIFIDSISVAACLCFQWCQGQPQAFSEPSGKPDTRAACSLFGQELISWLRQLQYSANKSVWFVGGLDEKLDEHGRTDYTPQIEGVKTALELPDVIDQVVTLAKRSADDGSLYRAIVNPILDNPLADTPLNAAQGT